MADKKISELNSASLPLAGTEVVPIVQGSETKKVAISDFKDVLEFADLASFPVTGESGKIYLALDTNLQYRWSGSAYVQIGGTDTQVYKTISTNTTLDDTYHSATVWVTATANITIPSGLRSDFNCTVRTFTGAIATYLTSGTIINTESDGNVQVEKSMAYIAQYSTNNYIISGGGLL